MKNTIVQLAALTKFGLVFFVMFSAYVSYSLGSTTAAISMELVLLMLAVYLAGSGSIALNQLMEMEFDAKMPRTSNRPLPSGKISPTFAKYLGLALIAGGVSLALLINWRTALVILLSAVSYLLIYTPLKRITSWNTWIGSISGALPALAGWTAAQNNFHLEGFFIPLVITLWQIPHFLALAWECREQYEAANFKMIVSQPRSKQIIGLLMFSHAIALIMISIYPYIAGLAGISFLIMSMILGFWLLFLISNFQKAKTKTAARKLFIHSNGYLLGLLVMIIVYLG